MTTLNRASERVRTPGTPALAPVLVAGPTAVGKSAVALELADRIGGEIISVDSMQVYRGMDIGTGKASPEERVRVPHHLLDVAGLDESYDAARFAREAGAAAAEIQKRGRVPILCGGTGLYFKAFLDGLGTAPPGEPSLRAELEAVPLPELLRELEERDPETFAGIDRRNRRRVIRAVEVTRLTGRPYAAQRSRWSRAAGRGGGEGEDPDRDRDRVFVLVRSAADLGRRIDARVEAMFAGGLVEETRRLQAAGLAANRTAMQAIGYRQVAEHLRGERALGETIALVKQRTRQYARRQVTWFRGQLDAHWIELAAEDRPAAVAERVRGLIWKL